MGLGGVRVGLRRLILGRLGPWDWLCRSWPGRMKGRGYRSISWVVSQTLSMPSTEAWKTGAMPPAGTPTAN